MAYFIGTDEAGYGPNLGPLVVTATLWETPDDEVDVDFYRRLAPVVQAGAVDAADDRRLAIADSKSLYKPGSGWSGLERGVLAALRIAGHQATTWRRVWQALAPDSSTSLEASPWYRGFDLPLPRDTKPELLAGLADKLDAACAAVGVRCRALRSAAVFPETFNDLIDQHGNKATALTDVTLSLVREMISSLADGPVGVRCDKHGGRNRYGAALQEKFPDDLVEVYREGREESTYRVGPAARRVEFRFTAKGESFLPTALASMTSKYLRELAMLPFNEFWQREVPGLRTTAGYPVDARRFRAEIQPAQQRLGIDDRILWRNR